MKYYSIYDPESYKGEYEELIENWIEGQKKEFEGSPPIKFINMVISNSRNTLSVEQAKELVPPGLTELYIDSKLRCLSAIIMEYANNREDVSDILCNGFGAKCVRKAMSLNDSL